MGKSQLQCKNSNSILLGLIFFSHSHSHSFQAPKTLMASPSMDRCVTRQSIDTLLIPDPKLQDNLSQQFSHCKAEQRELPPNHKAHPADLSPPGPPTEAVHYGSSKTSEKHYQSSCSSLSRMSDKQMLKKFLCTPLREVIWAPSNQEGSWHLKQGHVGKSLMELYLHGRE